MDNVFTIRKNKNLFYILPDDVSSDFYSGNNAVVLVNLFYKEELDFCFSYLDQLLNFIDIYIISSVDEILEISRDKGYKIIKKDNRGRDISALLVAAKDIIKNYDYICFVHDKNSSYLDKELVYEWLGNLWESSVCSKHFVNNILYLLKKNKDLGILFPPEPVLYSWPFYANDYWGDTFTGVSELCQKFNLKADIQNDIPPIGIGTVFWARTDALKKLLNYNWRYESFPQEPLAVTNTINHFIERSLAYFCQDAGYYAGTVTSIKYLNKNILMFYEFIGKSISFFKDTHISYSIKDFDSFFSYFIRKKKWIKQFIAFDKKIYIYGLTQLTSDFFEKLNMFYPVKIEGFLNKTKDIDIFHNLPVFSIDDLLYLNNFSLDDIFIIIVDIENDKIINLLKKSGFKNYIRYTDINI